MRLFLVLLGPCVPSCIYNQAQNETLGSKYSVCPHGILKRQGLLDFSINRIVSLSWVDECAVEVINLIGRCLTFNFTIEKVSNVIVILHFGLNGHDRASYLPVSLSIKLISSYVGILGLIGSEQANNIGWHSFI